MKNQIVFLHLLISLRCPCKDVRQCVHYQGLYMLWRNQPYGTLVHHQALFSLFQKLLLTCKWPITWLNFIKYLENCDLISMHNNSTQHTIWTNGELLHLFQVRLTVNFDFVHHWGLVVIWIFMLLPEGATGEACGFVNDVIYRKKGVNRWDWWGNECFFGTYCQD